MATDNKKEPFYERLGRPIEDAGQGVRKSTYRTIVLGEDGQPIRIMTVIGYDAVNGNNRPVVALG